MRHSTRNTPIDYFSIVLVTVTVTIVVWLLPMLRGKYADLTYPYIGTKEIHSHVLTVDELSKSHNSENNKPNERDSRPPCPIESPELLGLQLDIERLQWSEQYAKSFAKKGKIKPGGVWEPSYCKPRYSVTIIVPHRNRTELLHQFLLYMHSFLARQQLRYRIIVVDQNNKESFNRGKLFNIGYQELKKLPDLEGEQHCVILHDVDLLPMHDLNLYTCTEQPRHLSVAVDTFRFQLPYRWLCGGAIAIQARYFEKLNGFSNKFAGWGGEDDDFCFRLIEDGFEVVRFDPRVAIYTMMSHAPVTPSPGRYEKLAEAVVESNDDGLNEVKYTALPLTYHPLMLHVFVDW